MCILFGVCYGQVYIPTGVSSYSGIVRNIPTQYFRIPANTVLSDVNRAYIATALPTPIFIHSRINDDSNENQKKFNTDRNDQSQQIRKFTTEKDERTKDYLKDEKDKTDDYTAFTKQREDLLKATIDRNEKLSELIKMRTDKTDDRTYTRTVTTDKEPLTYVNVAYDADTIGRLQGFNGYDRYTTFNRFRDVNEFDRAFGRY